jgi:hypothetical protein
MIPLKTPNSYFKNRPKGAAVSLVLYLTNNFQYARANISESTRAFSLLPNKNALYFPLRLHSPIRQRYRHGCRTRSVCLETPMACIFGRRPYFHVLVVSFLQTIGFLSEHHSQQHGQGRHEAAHDLIEISPKRVAN